MPVSKFLWGQGFENEVTFSHALFDVLTDRPPKAGSEFVRGVATTDAWITGRDYEMSCQARWIPQLGSQQTGTESFLSGSRSVQDFLDWARDANLFRFVPDETFPDFYIPSCELVEPFRGSGDLTADLLRSHRLVIRNPDFDFLTALRGLMLEYQAGGNADDWTFSRTGPARYVNVNSDMASAATGILRDRAYYDGTHVTLLEAARTNLVTESEDISAWTSVDSITVTDDSLTLGTLKLAKLDDTDGGATSRQRIDVTLTGDAVKAVLIYAAKDTETISRFRLRDATAGADRLLVDLTWNADKTLASAVAATGTVLDTVRLGDAVAGTPVYEIRCQSTSVTAANTNRVELFPAAGPPEDTGSSFFGGVQVEDVPFPSSYIPTDGGTATRNAEQFSRSFIWKPQAMWVYVKFIELEKDWTTDDRVFQIGKSDETAPTVILHRKSNTSEYRLQHSTVSASQTADITTLSSAVGDELEFLCLFNADGSIQVLASKNGGGEIDSGASAALTPASAWSDTVFWLNSIGTSKIGLAGMEQMKTGAGTVINTIALARAQ